MRVNQVGWAALFLSVIVTGTAMGTLYDLGTSGWQMVVDTDLVQGNQIGVPYVYSQTSDAITIELDKVFLGHPDSQGNFSPLIVEFLKKSTNATPKIIIRDEYVVNDTNTDWYDYHMFLIVNALNPGAGFDASMTPGGNKLEQVSYSQYFGYDPGTGALPLQLNFVDTNGQGVQAEPPGDDIFKPGVDKLGNHDPIVIIVDPNLPVGARIGLKEFPTTPEPTTLVTILAMSGLTSLKRKRK